MRRRAWLSLFLLASAASGCRDARLGAPSPPPAPSTSTSTSPSTVGSQTGAAPDDREITDEALCALPVSAHVALDSARPFAPRYPHCPSENPFCDAIDAPPDAKDTCFVANQNVSRAERESRSSAAGAKGAEAAWDGIAKPKYLDRIDAHFHLTDTEHRRLRDNGFVVLDRLAYADYASAFHDVFQEQLPLYVGIDPAFHAVFRGTELVLERLEEKSLKPALSSLLRKLRAGLRGAKSTLPPDAVADLDLYLGVALGLADPALRDKKGLSLFGHDADVQRILEMADAAQMTDPETGVVLFGRPRVIDFSQLTPRGHYAHSGYGGGEGLENYFESVMWLSRLEFNLVSRSCRSSQPGATVDPEETPREAVDALALAEIAEQSGALSELHQFDAIYSVFAGKREDVPLDALLRLEKKGAIRASDPAAAAKLKTAIGNDFQRTARTHFMPEGASVLPAIATLFGQRIVPDTEPLTRLVHDRMPQRFTLGAADMAYVLGHDRAKSHLKSDLEMYPTLQRELDAARAETSRAALANDVYSSWLRAILAIGTAQAGTTPSFFRKDAYRDFKINSALVGYGQLRHAFVLLAAQGYDAYGCEIPDGYVEPLLPVWEALLAHVRKVRSVAKGFAGLERVVAMLRDIARTESTGAALSEPQKRWLGMVSEHVPNGGYGDTSEPPKWTGWYFDMFEDREYGASRTSAFVADYFTLTNAGKVKYIGADGPRLGVFVVDVGGVPRAMVGPVAKGYEAETEIAHRLDDEAAVTAASKSSPWRTSFAEPEAGEPAIGLVGRVVDCSVDGGPAQRRVAMRAKNRIGNVSVTLLDHHADPLGSPVTLDVGAEWKTATFTLPAAFAGAQYGVEALHVHVDDLAAAGLPHGAFDLTTSPSVFGWKDQPNDALPQRPKGARDFTIGVPRAAASAPPGRRPDPLD